MNLTNNLVYLDLEQTIIRSWQDPVLVNVDKIRNFLEKNNISEVGIFSFAIWSDEDKREFADDMKPSIEQALGVKVICWPSVQDMVRVEKNFTGIRFEQGIEVSEYIQLRGKKDGFMNYVMGTAKFTKAVLIDDVVPNITLSHRDYGWSIELYNVDDL